MPPVTAESFQERVLAQRAGLEERGKATPTYCAACSKRFSNFSAYENHLKSRKHLELERRAVEAVGRKVELLNAKNLEKGLAPAGGGKDALNAAIQQAIKAQPSSSPKKASGPAGGAAAASPIAADGRGSQRSRERLERPPRLQWFEQQAKKLAGEDEEEDEDAEEGWEDIDSDEGAESEEEPMAGEGEAAECEAAAQDPPGAEAIPVTDCLFCSHHSSSLMKNVAHMTKVHGFFIPDVEYLVDLRGLIKYLGEKVGVGKVCLWCNEKGKSFYATESVQAHMLDKSHCKLFTEGDAALEFADFYDFRSSYPDYQEGEDVEMSQEPEKNVEYDDETMELVLPSGARIGHRSLMRYYKQRFGSSQAVAVGRNRERVDRLVQQYKALGWTNSTGAGLARERDMQYLQRMKAKWMLKTGLKNNATKQMHFRAQVRF